MEDFLGHFLIGAIGALTGIYARQFCPHWYHKVAVGTSMLAVEAYVSMQLVG